MVYNEIKSVDLFAKKDCLPFNPNSGQSHGGRFPPTDRSARVHSDRCAYRAKPVPECACPLHLCAQAVEHRSARYHAVLHDRTAAVGIRDIRGDLLCGRKNRSAFDDTVIEQTGCRIIQPVLNIGKTFL